VNIDRTTVICKIVKTSEVWKDNDNNNKYCKKSGIKHRKLMYALNLKEAIDKSILHTITWT